MEARESGQDDRRPADSIALLTAPRPLLARAVIGTVRGTWWTVRYALFLPLLWVRGPVLFVLGWASVLAFVSLVMAFAFYVGPNREYLLVGMLGGGLAATAVRHRMYDAVLRLIEPK